MLSFDKEIFKDMVKKTSFAASIDEAKGIIVGVLMEIEPDVVNMVALDGFRMAVAREQMKSAESTKIIISSKIINEVNKIVSETEPEEVMDEEMWELNAEANGEIICRKLVKLGILEVTEEPSYYIRPSADAVPIHNDGTLEVKVPNAQKVGRVLVMDTDSHIGGGLFYPESADAVQQGRLIDADSLISDLEEWKENPNNDDSAVDLVNHFIGIIRATPSAHAVPQSEQYKKGFEDAKRAYEIELARSADAVQGEWVDIDNYYRMATCSHCRKVTMFEKWGEYTKPYNFCPNCGARMKGGAE
jgi:hypothetical protein